MTATSKNNKVPNLSLRNLLLVDYVSPNSYAFLIFYDQPLEFHPFSGVTFKYLPFFFFFFNCYSVISLYHTSTPLGLSFKLQFENIESKGAHFSFGFEFQMVLDLNLTITLFYTLEQRERK